MCAEVQLFLLNSLLNWDSINNVLLGPVLDSNESKPKGDILSFNHSFGTCSSVHYINFSDDTNSSNTFWITLSSHLETVGGGHISVCRQHAQNDGPWISHISICHSSGDLLNVVRLV